MSKYTTELRWIIEQINADHNFQTSYLDPIQIIDARIQNARTSIFSFDYPINPDDKIRFECNFLRHFYTREIGFETYTLWRLKLADELNMIIPKYNKLWDEVTKYRDIDLTANSDYQVIRQYSGSKTLTGLETLEALRTDNLQETSQGNRTRTDNLQQRDVGSDANVVNADRVRAYSDTPQGNMQNLLNEKYLTNLTHEYENGSTNTRNTSNTRNNTGTQQNTDNSTKNNTGTVKNENETNRSENASDTQNETVTHKGKNGGITYAEAILKARETYLNIDLMLCNELRDMFMLIW